MMTEKFMY